MGAYLPIDLREVPFVDRRRKSSPRCLLLISAKQRHHELERFRPGVLWQEALS